MSSPCGSFPSWAVEGVMKMRKFSIRLTAVLLTALMTLIFVPAAVMADEYDGLDSRYKVIIEDDADLLSPDEEADIAESMKDITVYGSAAFVTTASNPGSAPDYAERFFREKFGKGSGVVFLVDMDNRYLYIFSDGAIYSTITKAKANTITDNIYRYASKGDYYGCATEAFSEMKELLAGRKIAEPMKNICNAILAVLIAMLIFFIIIKSVSSARSASMSEMIEGLSNAKVSAAPPNVKLLRETRKYSPVSKSGGGSSGGGGGGGGHSGGGGGHGF